MPERSEGGYKGIFVILSYPGYYKNSVPVDVATLSNHIDLCVNSSLSLFSWM